MGMILCEGNDGIDKVFELVFKNVFWEYEW